MNTRQTVAISLLCFAVMSLGCGHSTSPFIPGTSLVTPTSPTSAGLTLLAMNPSSGPTAGGDYLRLVGTGFQSGASVTFDGVPARVTKVTATYLDARTQAHAAGTVDVVVTNPDGQTTTLKAGYSFDVFSVTGGPNLVAPGAELTVSWVASGGRGCSGGGDWIAMYRVGSPDDVSATNGHSDIWFDHVCGATSGTWKLKAPAEPGEYEFRFMVGDTSVARSGSITVRS